MKYHEGTWFAVPLRKGGGFATGVVTRATLDGGVVVAYFFGPAHHSVPGIAEVMNLTPARALRVLRISDLGLVDGSWPLIGEEATWRRDTWRTPAFQRTEDLTGRCWHVRYDDHDPNSLASEEVFAGPPGALERDAVWGAGAVELLMTHLLASN